VIDSRVRPPIDLTEVGRHLSRPKFQHGWLSDEMPGRGKLARGRWFGRWRVYFRGEDGREHSKKVEKVIDRALAEEMGFELAYTGPLNKTDARKVLEDLIKASTAAPPLVNPKMTFAELANEYIAMNRPGWGEDTARVSVQVIETHLIGKLGARPVRELGDVELQEFINGYVEGGASKSLLAKLKMYLRAILKRAVKNELIKWNFATDVKGRSQKASSSLSHTPQECAALYAVLSGRDHIAVRILVQLGLRPEELFALRRNDVRADQLMIDEAIPSGRVKAPKTEASRALVFVPPNLAIEMKHYLETVDASPTAWLFPSERKGVPLRSGNFLKRVLKPAAIRAGIAITKDAKGNARTALNFQSLRRTSATLFGDKAKDPKSTQAHMRHADPQVTLKHYQQAIPAEVKAAAIAFESDLLEEQRKVEEKFRAEVADVRPV